MRREGFELSVSPPRVVLRQVDGEPGPERLGAAWCAAAAGAARCSRLPCATHPPPALSYSLSLPPPTPPRSLPAGQRCEPLEEVVCEVEEAHAGEVIQTVTLRKGEVRVAGAPWAAGRAGPGRAGPGGGCSLLQTSGRRSPSVSPLTRHPPLLLQWLHPTAHGNAAAGARGQAAPGERASGGLVGGGASGYTWGTATPPSCLSPASPPATCLRIQAQVFECPSRGLIGFRSAFAAITRGTGVLHRAFAR